MELAILLIHHVFDAS